MLFCLSRPRQWDFNRCRRRRRPLAWSTYCTFSNPLDALLYLDLTSNSIIAIPAIGAIPEDTWRYPKDQSSPPQYLWSALKSVRIHLYTFDLPLGQQEYGITHYAEELLAALAANRDIGKRAIHFAAHR